MMPNARSFPFLHAALGCSAALVLLTVSVDIGAQPPVQVEVPSFTPQSPRLDLPDGSDLPPPLGAVTVDDCRPQQDAVVANAVARANLGGSAVSRDPEVHRDAVRQRYFDGGGLPRRMAEMGLSGTRIRESISFHGERSGFAVPECTEINSCVRASSLLDSRLESCLWTLALERGAAAGTAASRSDANPVGTAEATEAPASETCSEDERASIEQGVHDIDTRAQRYLQAHQGQVQASATPSVKLVMWIATEHSRLISQCGRDSAYKARLVQLEATFESARKTCVELAGDLGDWAPCGPVSPEALMSEQR